MPPTMSETVGTLPPPAAAAFVEPPLLLPHAATVPRASAPVTDRMRVLLNMVDSPSDSGRVECEPGAAGWWIRRCGFRWPRPRWATAGARPAGGARAG